MIVVHNKTRPEQHKSDKIVDCPYKCSYGWASWCPRKLLKGENGEKCMWAMTCPGWSDWIRECFPQK